MQNSLCGSLAGIWRGATLTSGLTSFDRVAIDQVLNVAVLIPCFNEERTIGTVVADFREALPGAQIYVYDNNSTDQTFSVAKAAGAIVRREARQGKGNVVRRMFSDVEADVYVMVDGDGTYDAAAAPRLIAAMLEGPYDQVVGARVHLSSACYRRGHVFGNKLLSRLVALSFGAEVRDMLSGYKVMSRRFVKTCPVVSQGFEIETELLVHALHLDLPLFEIETSYRERPEGSVSKLSTYKDGARIVALILELVRDLLPLRFFGFIGAMLAPLSIVLAIPLVVDFLKTGLVARLPTAVLATGVMLVAVLALFTGLILDSVVMGRREVKLLAYLRYASCRNDD